MQGIVAIVDSCDGGTFAEILRFDLQATNALTRHFADDKLQRWQDILARMIITACLQEASRKHDKLLLRSRLFATGRSSTILTPARVEARE
jgi:hypothetical protein